MSDETTIPDPSIVLQSNSNVPIVPIQQPLTEHEIERMCKAFIKLLLEMEKQSNGNSDKINTNIPA